MDKAGMALRRSNALLVVLILALFTPAAGAQTSGEVRGTVKSADGQPLAGVTITLFHAGKSESVQKVSDAEGSFQFPDLAGGVYVASATLEGYAPVTCPGVRIISGLTRELRLTLTAADSSQPSTCEPA